MDGVRPAALTMDGVFDIVVDVQSKCVDGLVSKHSEQEEAGDVLMVGVDRTHGSEVLR